MSTVRNIDPNQIDPTTTPATQDPALKVTAELQLREQAKKNKELQDEINALKQKEADIEAKKLEEQGKFKELLEKEKAEKLAIIQERNHEKRQIHIENELKKSGINPEFLDLITPDLLKKVEFDENNQPKNLTEIIYQTIELRPSMFNQSPAIPAGSVGVQATTSNTNQLTKEQAQGILERNNYDEISKHQKEISRVLQV